MVPGKKRATNFIWLKNDETGDDLKQEQVAQYMNKFFTSVGPDLASKHNERWVYFGEKADNILEDFQTDVDEVIPIIKGIETMKSSGIDEIASRICKHAFLVLPEQLTHLFNCSLRHGIFPDEWKAAKVVPHFKRGE